ncbi:MAG: response regulator, partial [Candidatus Subteraquimicrobiales bacterium]|nr:response regulator [Candidatus Subteraquimicrobiales bacterium]
MDKGKILVVDDEAAIVKLVSVYLSKEGYSVVAAFDGVEALERVEEEKPDLIILDLKLPGVTGTEILADIRAQGRKVPVIVCTAVLPPKLEIIYKRWTNEVIIKPV